LQGGAKKPRKGPLEVQVSEKVRGLDGFWQALKVLSAATGLEEEELQLFAEDLCGVCWTQAEQVASSEGPLKSANEELAKMKQRLHQCNLNAMKDIAAAKAGAHIQWDLGVDTVTFHEPLQYLDNETKEMVLTLVNEKVRLLEDGRAPPSLVDALIKQATALQGGGAGGPADAELAEELERTMLDLKQAKTDLSSARLRADDAEVKAEKADDLRIKAEKQQEALRLEAENLKYSLAQAEALANGLKKELADAKEALEQAEAKRKEAEAAAAQARRELEELQQLHSALQEEHKALQEVSEQQKQQLEDLATELEAERQANSELRDNIAQQQAEIAKLHDDLEEIQDRYATLKEEADKMRAELARRNNTKTHGTQTTLTGDKLDEDKAEMKKLKVMLEELQMKMKELIEKLKRKGMGKEVQQIAEELGLADILKEQTVFQRLYDDAVDRVQRLEKLRDKIRREKRQLLPNEPEVPEVSVMDSIGESGLPGLQGLVQDRSLAVTPARSSAFPPLGGAQLPQQQPRIMRPVASLPALAQQPKPANVITLGYGGRGSRQKHGLI